MLALFKSELATSRTALAIAIRSSSDGPTCYLVAEPSLWERLDLSAGGGLTCTLGEAALRGALARSRGGLRFLDISGHAYTPGGWGAQGWSEWFYGHYAWNVGALPPEIQQEFQDFTGPAYTGVEFSRERFWALLRAHGPSRLGRGGALAAALEAHGGALCELVATTTCNYLQPLQVSALLEAAPSSLRMLVTDLEVHMDTAVPMLRNEPPYGPLRLRNLSVLPEGLAEPPPMDALFAAVAAHPSLRDLKVPTYTAADLAALADAAVTIRLPTLRLLLGDLGADDVSILARLLRDGALETLHLRFSYMRDDLPGLGELADALRQCTTLKQLELHGSPMQFAGLRRNNESLALLFAAVEAHSSLCVLDLHSTGLGHDAHAALAAVVAADAPALHELRLKSEISSVTRDISQLPLLIEALPRNTHLRTLDFDGMVCEHGFAQRCLLPAVRANTSLRRLRLLNGLAYGTYSLPPSPAVQEAMDLVAARAERDAAAA
jgi:hypothetical protein